MISTVRVNAAWHAGMHRRESRPGTVTSVSQCESAAPAGDVARCAAVDPRSGGTGEEADFGLFYAAFAVGPSRRREAMTAPRQVEEQCAGGGLFCFVAYP